MLERRKNFLTSENIEGMGFLEAMLSSRIISSCLLNLRCCAFTGVNKPYKNSQRSAPFLKQLYFWVPL